MELAAILIVSGVGLLGWAAWSGRKPSDNSAPDDLLELADEDAAPPRMVPFIPLLPGPEHRPEERFESVVAGVHLKNADGSERQDIVAELSVGSELCLVRDFEHEEQDQAVAVFTADARMLGYLPRDLAPVIAAILDRKRPVGARISAIEPFGGRTHPGILGLRLSITAYRKAKTRKSGKGKRAEVSSVVGETARENVSSAPE